MRTFRLVVLTVLVVLAVLAVPASSHADPVTLTYDVLIDSCGICDPGSIGSSFLMTLTYDDGVTFSNFTNNPPYVVSATTGFGVPSFSDIPFPWIANPTSGPVLTSDGTSAFDREDDVPRKLTQALAQTYSYAEDELISATTKQRRVWNSFINLSATYLSLLATDVDLSINQPTEADFRDWITGGLGGPVNLYVSTELMIDTRVCTVGSWLTSCSESTFNRTWDPGTGTLQGTAVLVRTPEPSSVALLGIGLTALVGARRRNARRS